MSPWFRQTAKISPELQAELDRPPRWMYEWPLSGDRSDTAPGDELVSVHATRAEMMEPAVRAALHQASRATAIDLACNEGWFAHRLLDWGAQRVTGLDIREQNVARATLVADHYGVTRERLSFKRADVFDLPLEPEQTYDVVLMLGLIYHVENPVGAIRRARALTRGIAVIESQLTRQTEPIVHGWGVAGEFEVAQGSFAVRYERDQETNALASAGGVLSLVPNEEAMRQMALVAGFREIEFLSALPHHNAQYLDGDRAVMVCRV